MESSQLAVIDFNQINIPMYGSRDSPRFAIKDIMIKLLKYENSTSIRWFTQMKNHPKYAKYWFVQSAREDYLSEMGLYEALFRSKKDIAQDFRIKVELLLIDLRQQISNQLEEEKKQNMALKQENEDLKAPRPACVYKLFYQDRLLYIGQDTSKAQDRIQQHLRERRKIAQGNQIIDIFLATINEQDIKTETMLCDTDEVDDLERSLIQELHPEYNQAMNGKKYICAKCDPTKIYKNRGSYEKHMITNH